jgi:ATP-dependent DNA helicase RecG
LPGSKTILLNLFGENEAPTNDFGWEQRLEGLGWMAKQPGGHHVCTVSGLILFGRAPHRYLPQAGIRRIETGLIERFEQRATPFLSTDVPTVASMRRERQWHYPREALREAIMNALVHRDWTRTTEVEVVAYADRIEIKSPGSLVNSMTVEKVIAGQCVPRNPHLTEVMRDYGYDDDTGEV